MVSTSGDIVGKCALFLPHFVRFSPLCKNELPDMPVEQFLSSLRFDQRGKLDQLGINISSIE